MSIIRPICAPTAGSIAFANTSSRGNCVNCDHQVSLNQRLEGIIRDCRRAGEEIELHCERCFIPNFIGRTKRIAEYVDPINAIELDAMQFAVRLCDQEGITDPDDFRVIYECLWRILRGRAGLPKDITQAKRDYTQPPSIRDIDEHELKQIIQTRAARR